MAPDAGPPPSPARVRATEVEAEILQAIRPDPPLVEAIDRARASLVRRATEEAARRTIPLRRAIVAGSAARGTFLRDVRDLDLFLLFPPEISRQELETLGLELAAATLEAPQKRYAEHPYLRGQFQGFFVDAVPGYAIDDPSHPMTAVDRTPFHQQYLLERLTPERVDQVRLAKQFLRGLGIYGSEARTAGFSGYLTELLVVRFGSLDGLLAAAETWRIPVRLASTAARMTVPDEVALLLDDPVDPHRNVASALSRANLALFILAAHEYLQRPRREAFFPPPRRPVSLEEARARIRARGTHVAVMHLARPAVVDDILFPQLFKAERALAAEAARLGFEVTASATFAGEHDVWAALEVVSGVLSSVRTQDGPPPGLPHTDAFLAKWTAPGAPVLQGPYLRPDGRLAVDVARSERRLEPLLGVALDRLPVGKDLRDSMARSGWIRSLDDVPPTPDLASLLDRMLDRRLPWLAASPELARAKAERDAMGSPR
jgi:tRNA nucleotidyltransferase (CCA-adding enzyme)